jgi:hypothetical protein
VEYRVRKIQELLEKRDQMLLSNMEWARLTQEPTIDSKGKGINYQTIRRMELGGIPRGSTLRMLERALEVEEAKRANRQPVKA